MNEKGTDLGEAHTQPRVVSSGLLPLDQIIQSLRLGDNVVWQVDALEDYVYFAGPFFHHVMAQGFPCVYVRFAPHQPIFSPRQGLEIVRANPALGFDAFSGQVHRLIERHGRETCYVFDNLSALVVEWATDELLANFFQVTCPYLFELDTIAYFALTRGQHAHHAVARVRETTQVLIDVYSADGQKYIHPLKVWERYSPQMFLPHAISGETWSPVFGSGDAARLTTTARRWSLDTDASTYAPWESVYRRLVRYRRTGKPEDVAERAALKREFSRMLIGDHPPLNPLVDRHLTLEDLFTVRSRLIGSGRIGGKAAGMLLARRILEEEESVDCSTVLEGHDSFYVGSDVFFTFLVNNDLFRLRLQLIKDPSFSHEAFRQVEERFLRGTFPPEIVEQFRKMLDYFGQAPIIVRSSSLLEDSFGSAFAGKYRSEYCANQGDPDDRLRVFLRAMKLVYASALNPDVLSYRRKRGLDERDEQMAILVQRVSGRPYHHYFFPDLAGVALSRNLYVWTDRIDPSQGLIRLVFGLGTRAVDRVGFDYPRMIPVSHPQLRPETGTKITKYSQRQVDVIDLQENRLATLPFSKVVDRDYPQLHLFVSEMRERYLYDPVGNHIQTSPEGLVLTFNNLLRRTTFIDLMGRILDILEEAYGHPVEMEFTAAPLPDGRVRINLLQCRPMGVPGTPGSVEVPERLAPECVLFESTRFIGGGTVDRIRYVILVDPVEYASLTSLEMKRALGRMVGQINARLRAEDGRELIMGPGRFGSSNINLGVGVSYSDIDNASVLVEVAREEAGQVPEVSYGTHFFQDLVESHTVYLAIYPDDPAAQFNRAFFERAPNVLTDLLPEAAGFEGLVRVIDIYHTTGDYAAVVADPARHRAICFLDS